MHAAGASNGVTKNFAHLVELLNAFYPVKPMTAEDVEDHPGSITGTEVSPNPLLRSSYANRQEVADDYLLHFQCIGIPNP